MTATATTTAAELAEQLLRAKLIDSDQVVELRAVRVSLPMTLADSGNGYHLLPLVDLPNDDTSKELVKQLLTALGNRFNNGTVKIDAAVFNAARITKLYGTIARKGDSTEDRPHRRS